MINFEIIEKEYSKDVFSKLIYTQTTFDFKDVQVIDPKNKTFSSNTHSSHTSLFQEYTIPLELLKRNSSLQAIVLYLKNNHDLNFSTIAKLLNRDPRTIWTTYTKAKESINTINREIHINDKSNATRYTFPVAILSSRNMSVLESIVFYMKNTYELSYQEISTLLEKNYRTIWTVYARAMKKIGND